MILSVTYTRSSSQLSSVVRLILMFLGRQQAADQNPGPQDAVQNLHPSTPYTALRSNPGGLGCFLTLSHSQKLPQGKASVALKASLGEPGRTELGRSRQGSQTISETKD